MKILLSILIIITTITCHKVETDKQAIFDYVYELAKNSRSGYSWRKAKVIIEKSEKHCLNARIMANLAHSESSFRRNLVNPVSGCIGMYQISPKWWSHLVHYVEDGKYNERVKADKDYEKYMKFIGVNVEMACIIMRTYLDEYGNYRDALYKYGGWEIDRFKNSPKRDIYVAKVLR